MASAAASLRAGFGCSAGFAAGVSAAAVSVRSGRAGRPGGRREASGAMVFGAASSSAISVASVTVRVVASSGAAAGFGGSGLTGASSATGSGGGAWTSGARSASAGGFGAASAATR
ncbi:hypothetical protein EP867_13900 [Falsigemmobacter intermedius]|uniref:Uncharacterized protein n=1 Tax=Falsigemmobacter intermedius TaxID=1553448 RepID=A0A3S4XNG9_9RHOB|nr:hypothetical protein EP867_13900 [Falsigemmobacter intermedius]